MDDITIAGIGANVIILIVVILVIGIGLFLLFRSIFLWYWKIDTIVDKQSKTINILNNILEELQKNNLKQ